MRTYVLGGALLLGAALIAVLLIVFQPTPDDDPEDPTPPVVSTEAIEIQSGTLSVRGNGTVRPANEIELTAEVAGRLVEVAPAFVSGGSFRAGEVLARIDPSDYESQVRQARAQVTQAEFEVLQAEEEVEVARAEFARLERTAGESMPDSTALGRLVFREPQLRLAEASLESARASLETAETNLGRTALIAPFNGQVRVTQADRGAFVAAGTPVATLFSTDVVDIRVPLEARRAALIPGLWRTSETRNGVDGPPVTVEATYGASTYRWDGFVDRVDGARDEETRTINVMVRVPDPYQLDDSDADRPPLAVGSYVTTEIAGRTLDRYFTVPRRAIRDDDQLWTVEDDTLLVMRSATVVQTAGGRAFVTADDVADGTPIITGNLPVVSDSMTVRLANTE